MTIRTGASGPTGRTNPLSDEKHDPEIELLRIPAGTGGVVDEFLCDRAHLGVGRLRLRLQQLESFFGAAAASSHDDALGLLDDFPRLDGLAELLRQRTSVPIRLRVRERDR